MATTVKIAPDLDEIKREGNEFCCDFNGMAIRWRIEDDCSDMDAETEQLLKEWLQTAIGMSDRLWQVPYMLNEWLPFESKVFINGEEQKFPPIEK